MSHRPTGLILDALGTLLDPAPLAERMADLGLPAHLVAPWLERTVARGQALDEEDGYRPFHEVAADTLAEVMTDHGRFPEVAAVERVMSGLARLPLFEDVEPLLILARDAGLRVAVLTNGDPDAVRRTLARDGLQDHVQRYLGAEEVGHWKPRLETYLAVSAWFGLPPERLALLSVHPWDLAGARAAGCATAWVNRPGRRWTGGEPRPEVEGRHLVVCLDRLLDLPHRPEAR